MNCLRCFCFNGNRVLRARWLAAMLLVSSHLVLAQPACDGAETGEQLLWGDLHVHTAYSLDAYAFGAITTPKDAYAFARGQPLRLLNGDLVAIDRPLDFVAVTDHAATYDVMYVCTDPGYSDSAYCRAIREGRDARDARRIFNDYLLPLVSDVPPQPAAVCAEKGVDCAAASASQWRRTQMAANEANEPCAFTALIGYEWTPSPGGRHWHRNVIFRSDNVPGGVVDYIRYPQVTSLWRELSRTCRREDGCDVLTIPHNINWADGGPTFDVENAPSELLKKRVRYERLAEIHQEKGNSECLAVDPDATDDDCAFEIVTENAAKAHLSGPEDITPEDAWQRMRSSYYRSLLGRGLQTYRRTDGEVNPYLLGAIGSTDTHFGTPGAVNEEGYIGGVFALWMTDEERLARPGYNPGGLVAVWAQENTRAAVFDALYERRAYATSGPRIRLDFGVTANDSACGDASVNYVARMGTVLPKSRTLTLTVQAARDDTPLEHVQIVKGELAAGGRLRERVIDVAHYPDGRGDVCVSWRDPGFDPDAPAFWYARVIEQSSPRWTQRTCERAGVCDRYPELDVSTHERAWSSPVWHLP